MHVSYVHSHCDFYFIFIFSGCGRAQNCVAQGVISEVFVRYVLTLFCALTVILCNRTDRGISVNGF